MGSGFRIRSKNWPQRWLFDVINVGCMVKNEGKAHLSVRLFREKLSLKYMVYNLLR